MRILVTAANGIVGTAVCSQLIKNGETVRALVHKKEYSDKLSELGVKEICVGDMLSKDDLKTDMDGVDAVFHICSAANENEYEIGKNVIDTATECGDIYFVYHSVLHSILPDLPRHAQKLKIEQYLIASGLDYTILQPAVFMQNLMTDIGSLSHGGPLLQKFYVGNDTKMCFLNVADYAEAVGVVFKNHLIGATLELCGQSNVSLDDLTSAFQNQFGREMTLKFITDDEFLKAQKLNPESYKARTMLKMFEHYNKHGFPGNSSILTELIGCEPHTLEKIIAQC